MMFLGSEASEVNNHEICNELATIGRLLLNNFYQVGQSLLVISVPLARDFSSNLLKIAHCKFLYLRKRRLKWFLSVCIGFTRRRIITTGQSVLLRLRCQSKLVWIRS